MPEEQEREPPELGNAFAVFPDREAADHAVRDLIHDGVPPQSIHVDGPEAQAAVLQAEMREETEHSFAGPGFPPVTKEMMRAGLTAVVLGATIGAGVAAPFAFIDFGPVWWARLIMLCVIGGVGGGTIGVIAGGGIMAKGPAAPAAAHRGVVISVLGTDLDVVARLRRCQPIRIDLVSSDGVPLTTVATEEDDQAEGLADQVTDRVHQDPGAGEDWATASREEIDRRRRGRWR